MSVILTLAVTFFAGMGAGLGTGFAGMSAVTVIGPMPILPSEWDLLRMFWRVPFPHGPMERTKIWTSGTDL